MGKCPSCGNKGWRLKIEKCIICGKEGCDKCLSHLIELWHVVSTLTSDPVLSGVLNVCSPRCMETFMIRVENEITPRSVQLDMHTRMHEFSVSKFVHLALNNPKNHYYFDEELSEMLAMMYVRNTYRFSDEDLEKRIVRTEQLTIAQTLEKVRRFEEAAKIYEEYKMFEEAGKARAEDKHITVKRTEVSVDLNSLLKQIGDGGIVVVYRCPHCGGKLKVGKGTNFESLKTCEHCGSEIKAMELADFLKTALS